MKKSWIAGAAVALAGAGAAVPYWTGMRAETAFKTNLEALSQHPQVEANLVRYERHWFSAEARSRVVLTPGGERLTLRLDHDIRHGPRPSVLGLARVTSSLIVPTAYRSAVSHYYGDAEPLTADLAIGLTGAQDLSLSSPAFEGAPLGNPTAQASWGGLTGHLHLSSSADSGTLELEMPGLELHDNDGNIVVGKVTTSSRFERKAEDLWLGSTDFRAARFELAFPDPEASGDRRFSFRGLEGSQGVAETEKERFLTMESRWQVEQARLDDQEIRDAEFGLEARHIHAPTLQTLNRRFRDLQRQELDQEALRRRTLTLLRDLLPRFLDNSPELAVTKLSFRTAQGEFEGEADVRYRGGDGNGAMALANPSRLLQRTTAEARVRVAKALLSRLLEGASRAQAAKGLGPEAEPGKIDRRVKRMVQQRLGMLQGLGLLEAENGHYTTRARWEEGRISVNGQPLNGLAQGMLGGTGPGQP